jgi:SAM-dependent methyltransferase
VLTAAPPSEAPAQLELLARLYDEYLASDGADGYMQAHADPAVVYHHVNVFGWYAAHIARGSCVLDWGCNHGPDSCLLRHRFGDELDLHACDFAPADAFGPFRDYARPKYTRLTDPIKLPYADGSFDAVVASGTLEHVAMDGESLKELYRVLRPDGILVVTYLPYEYSWSEWRLRSRNAPGHHRRRYTFGGLDRLLITHGFLPEQMDFQGLLPNRIAGKRKRPLWWSILRPILHPVVDALWRPVLRPLRYPFFRQTVLCALARKVYGF